MIVLFLLGYSQIIMNLQQAVNPFKIFSRHKTDESEYARKSIIKDKPVYLDSLRDILYCLHAFIN